MKLRRNIIDVRPRKNRDENFKQDLNLFTPLGKQKCKTSSEFPERNKEPSEIIAIKYGVSEKICVAIARPSQAPACKKLNPF